MVWEYLLIGFIVGALVAACALRFFNPNLQKQLALQKELARNKAELENYRKELVGHFAQSADLLNSMAKDYRQLYQHMAKSSNELLPDLPLQNNPFHYQVETSGVEAENDQALVQAPKDYPDVASGLLRVDTRS